MARVQSNLPWVSHPQVAFEIARKAREPFNTWIPAFAGMTTVLFGGLRQKSPNPPYMNYLLLPGVQQNSLHPFGGANTR
jgi:hypothetical protein